MAEAAPLPRGLPHLCPGPWRKVGCLGPGAHRVPSSHLSCSKPSLQEAIDTVSPQGQPSRYWVALPAWAQPKARGLVWWPRRHLRAGLTASATGHLLCIGQAPGLPTPYRAVLLARRAHPPACPHRGIQQEAPVPVPHHLPHGSHLLPGHHQPATHQCALRAGTVCLGARRAGAAAQDGFLLRRGQGAPQPHPTPGPSPLVLHRVSCMCPPPHRSCT